MRYLCWEPEAGQTADDGREVLVSYGTAHEAAERYCELTWGSGDPFDEALVAVAELGDSGFRCPETLFRVEVRAEPVFRAREEVKAVWP
jgi:hypothetical protein